MRTRKQERQLDTFNRNNALTLPAPAKGRIFYRAADGPTTFRLMVTETELSHKEVRDKAEELRGLVAKGRDHEPQRTVRLGEPRRVDAQELHEVLFDQPEVHVALQDLASPGAPCRSGSRSATT